MHLVRQFWKILDGLVQVARFKTFLSVLTVPSVAKPSQRPRHLLHLAWLIRSRWRPRHLPNHRPRSPSRLHTNRPMLGRLLCPSDEHHHLQLEQQSMRLPSMTSHRLPIDKHRRRHPLAITERPYSQVHVVTLNQCVVLEAIRSSTLRRILASTPIVAQLALRLPFSQAYRLRVGISSTQSSADSIPRTFPCDQDGRRFVPPT